MYHRCSILPLKFTLILIVALTLNSLVLFAPPVTARVHAQTGEILLQVEAPPYGQPGQTITYEVILQNSTSQSYTNLAFYNALPANTTYVSGGVFNAAEKRVEFTLASLAPNTTYRVTWVARANSNVAIGAFIINADFDILQITPDATYGTAGAVSTVVEAPGTLIAVYKNASGTPFNVAVHGYQFANYGNDGIPNPNDDLSKTDVFELFGPGVCQSGKTAATCVLSGPAQAWLKGALAATAGGHCDGMAATSLRLFNSLPFRQYSGPATFQAGATNTINLNFPAQPIENYIARYFHTQSYIWDSHFVGTPVQTVDKLIADFNKTPSVGYTLGFWLANNLDRFDDDSWKNGHAVTAYGVERVNANEDRILVYDNNFPKQRKYFTINRAANTWRYVTAASPGEPEDAYAGTAFSLNLHLVPLSARDLPAGQYFACPFCNTGTVASAQASASGLASGTIDFTYTGEGAILVVNDQDQATGFAFDTETFINEIPDAQIFPFEGGLGKDIPPLITVPFTETDTTLYSVYISGKTIDSVADGGLLMTGNGFAMGMDAVQLDPNELLQLTIGPDGDFIAFNSTQSMAAPPLYIAYDPISDQDASVIFDVTGPTLTAGEQIWLTLDPDRERVYFDDTSALGQQFDVTMSFVWPDGDEQNYTQAIEMPAGATSAFIDFGAWDGLLSPPIYINDVLQNTSVNHRLKLEQVSGLYAATAQANAPAGVYHIDATFKNVTEITLQDLYFSVADLAAGNVLLNADGSPAGQDATLTVPNTALGDDGLLSVNESVTVRFSIGLAKAEISDLTIDANGMPYDWVYDAPPLDGEAQNASFVLPVRADNPLYLPLVRK